MRLHPHPSRAPARAAPLGRSASSLSCARLARPPTSHNTPHATNHTPHTTLSPHLGRTWSNQCARTHSDPGPARAPHAQYNALLPPCGAHKTRAAAQLPRVHASTSPTHPHTPLRPNWSQGANLPVGRRHGPYTVPWRLCLPYYPRIPRPQQIPPHRILYSSISTCCRLLVARSASRDCPLGQP